MANTKPKMAFKVRDTESYPVLWPADTFTREWIASQAPDTLHWVTAHKPRSPQYFRAIHKLCVFLGHHVEKFSRINAHAILKRLQLESTLYCDETFLTIKGFGEVRHLIPQSIGFDNMDESEFRAFFDALSDHIREVHWPEFSFDLLDKQA